MEKGIEESNIDKIIENARGYAQLLQEHISKEDDILYPMADEVLSPNIKNNILEKFKRFEVELGKEENKYLFFIKAARET